MDDPSSWNATNFVSAESFPDSVIGLARQNNQIVAFGKNPLQNSFIMLQMPLVLLLIGMKQP